MNELLIAYLATLQQRRVELDAEIQRTDIARRGLIRGRKLECEKTIADVERLIHDCEVAGRKQLEELKAWSAPDGDPIAIHAGVVDGEGIEIGSETGEHK